MCCLLLDLDLSLKVKQEKVAKVVGVVIRSHVGKGYDFMSEKDRSA